MLTSVHCASDGCGWARGADINETNIFENGILDAFIVTQRGGHAPLLNRIFQGINVAGLGTVDGVRITGSDAVRFNATTQTMIANGNVGAFADYLSNTNQFTTERGGLLRRAGLPENFVIPNPQVGPAYLFSNFGSSTYHSFQTEVTKRFTAGWMLQANYTLSRALGDEEGDGIGLLVN